jgi:hypothetical protein
MNLPAVLTFNYARDTIPGMAETASAAMEDRLPPPSSGIHEQ